MNQVTYLEIMCFLSTHASVCIVKVCELKAELSPLLILCSRCV